jgi:hypothetical protein
VNKANGVEYYVVDRGVDRGDEDVLHCTTTWDARYPHRVAEDCADDYHRNHDGWEAAWPMKFHVSVDGKKLGTFEVDREALPHFRAVKVA